MKPLFHTFLLESDLEQAHQLSSLLTDLPVVVTTAATLDNAQVLLNQLLPNLLMVRVQSATARTLYARLPTLLTSHLSPTLLYSEQAVLLDAMAAALPYPVATMLWPCSQAALVLQVLPLLRHLEPLDLAHTLPGTYRILLPFLRSSSENATPAQRPFLNA